MSFFSQMIRRRKGMRTVFYFCAKFQLSQIGSTPLTPPLTPLTLLLRPPRTRFSPKVSGNKQSFCSNPKLSGTIMSTWIRVGLLESARPWNKPKSRKEPFIAAKRNNYQHVLFWAFWVWFSFPGWNVVLLQLPHIGENYFLNCIKKCGIALVSCILNLDELNAKRFNWGTFF